MICPRRAENPGPFNLPSEDRWRDDGTCPYCGSASPDLFFEAIEAGVELTPTDKSYKVYVQIPDSREGQELIVGTSNGELREGWTPVDDRVREIYRADGGRELPSYVTSVQISKAKARKFGKFYFQHLSLDERRRFVDLYNERKVKLAYPGHFYVLPFFMGRVSKESA